LEISQIDDRPFFWLLSVLVEDSQAHSLTTRQIMAQDGSATNQQPIVRAIAASVSALCAPLARPPPDSQATAAAGAGGRGKSKKAAAAAAAAAVVAPRQGYYGSDRLTSPMLLEVRQSIAMLEAWLYKAQGALTLKHRVSTAVKKLDGEDDEQHRRRIEVVLRDFETAFPALVNDQAFVVPSAIEVAGNGGSDGQAEVDETPPAKRQRLENDAAKAATALDAASTTLTAALKTLLGDTRETARKLANTGLVGLAKDTDTVAADEDQGGFVESALASYVKLEGASAEADEAVDDLPADGDAV
jgi:hypothetical protein